MANKLLQQLVKKRVLSKAKESNLKAATPVVEDPTLQTWIKDVTSTVKEMASSGVRRSDLVKAGIAVINNGELQTALKPDEEFNLTVPAAVMNLTANGAYSSITLTWTTKASKYFGMNIIYRSDVDDFGTATQIGSSAGDVYTDYVGNNIKAYYWVRTVSMYGVEGELAPSVSAETAIDVEYLLEQITGQINESHLDELLRSDLSSIDEIEAALLAESAERIEAIKQKAIELSNMAATLRQELESKIGMIVADLNLKTADLNIKTTNLDQKAVDLDQRVAGLKEEVSSLISSVNEQVSSLSTAIQADIDALNDGLTQEIKSRTDGDKSITTSLNAYKQSNDNAVAVILDKAETAISSSSATATDVTALQTRMTTAEGNINKKTDATAFNALTTKVNGLDDKVEVNSSSITSLTANLETVTDTADTALSTASSAKSTAESAVTQNTALSKRVDSLAASITDLDEGAQTNVDVYAFNALKAEVTSQGNEIDANTTDISDHTKKINANTQSITSLGSRLTTAEGKVTGNTTAINSVKTTQTTQGNQISQAVEDITALENSIETITDDLSAKADASTVSRLTNDVTSLDGKIKTTADSLLALTNKVGTVEGNLSKKVDSTALVNYYTTTQTDSKILETTAGEISKYDASLSIGGVNLLTTAELTAGDVLNRLSSTHTFVDDPTCPSGNTNVVKVTSSGGTGGIYVSAGDTSNNNKGEIFTASVWLKGAKGGEIVYITEGHTPIPAGSHTFTLTTTWKRYSCQLKRTNDTTFNFVVYSRSGIGSIFYASRIQYEKGTKMSAWSHPQQVLKDAVNANATAISTTNAEVLKQDGRITANSNRIDNLSTSIDNLSGSKLDASVIAGYYTKGQTDDKIETVSAGKLESYDSKLTVGGKNLFSFNAWAKNKITPQPSFTTVPVAPVELLPNTTYTISTNFPVRAIDQPAFDIFLTTNKTAASSTINGVALDMPRTFKTGDTGIVYVHYRSVVLGPGKEHWIQIERGSKATEYEPCQADLYSLVSHADSANAKAISATTTEVEKQDKRIAANANQIDALNTSINNLNGNKLDASVISGYYTKAQTDNKIETVSSGKVEEFKASIGPLLVNEFIGNGGIDSLDGWILSGSSSNHQHDSTEGRTKPGSVKAIPSLSSGFRIASTHPVTLVKGQKYTISFWFKTTSDYVQMTTASAGLVTNPEGNPIAWIPSSQAQSWDKKSTEWTEVKRTFTAAYDATAYFRIGCDGLTAQNSFLWIDDVSVTTDFVEQPLSKEIRANAVAVSVTNAEVLKQAGRITANSSRIDNLNTKIDLVDGSKVSADAFNSLATRVEATEKEITSESSALTSLKNSYNAFKESSDNLAIDGDFKKDPLLGSSLTRCERYVGDGYGRSNTSLKFFTIAGNNSYGQYDFITLATSPRKRVFRLMFASKVIKKFGQPQNIAFQVAYAGKDSTALNFFPAVSRTTTTDVDTDWVLTSGIVSIPENAGSPVIRLVANQNMSGGEVLVGGCSAIDITDAYEVKQIADANVEAISTLNTSIKKVDDRVTVEANKITTLNSDLTNLKGQKLDASVISGYYTKAQTDNKIETVSSGKVESFSASLSFDNTNLLRNTSVERVITGANTTNQGFYYIPFNKKTLGETLRDFSVGDSITLSFRWEAESGSKGTIRPQVNGVPYAVAGGSFEVSTANLSGYYTATSKITQSMLDSTGTSMGFRLDNFVGKVKITELMLQHSSKATGWVPSHLDVTADLDANATAIQSTNAEVTRVDGRVTTESNRITALTGRMGVVEGAVTTKADVSALNSLTTRVGNVEGGLSTQASSITSLEAGLRSAASSALDLIPNPTFDPLYNQMGFNVVSSSLSTVPSGCPYPYVARLASRDHSATYTSMPGIACKQGDVYEMSVLVACGAGSADFNLYVYKMASVTAGQSALASGGNTKTTSEWKRVTWRWTVPAGCYFFRPFLQISQSSPFGTVWYATDWHCVNVTAGAKAQGTADATANALTATNAEVSRVDGRVTSQASQITKLESDNSDNKNALAIQAKVINGVKANYMVKMETNGVIGGFGMIQEAGTLGQVRTEFGIRADRFYVVPPGQDLTKGVVPFVIDNNKVIIDAALIKDGSITNAKIGNLSADKITAGNIAADRMKANIVAAAQGQFTTLSALSAKIGVLRTATSGARTEIKDNLIEVYDSSGKLRVRLGVWS